MIYDDNIIILPINVKARLFIDIVIARIIPIVKLTFQLVFKYLLHPLSLLLLEYQLVLTSNHCTKYFPQDQTDTTGAKSKTST